MKCGPPSIIIQIVFGSLLLVIINKDSENAQPMSQSSVKGAQGRINKK